MKRLMLFLALGMGLGISSMQAQACAKSKGACCKHASAASVEQNGHADAAAKLASLDENIEVRTDEKSGNVSYVRKVSDATGAVTYAPVAYDAERGQFVDAKACGAKGAGAAGCCAGKKGSLVETTETEESTVPARGKSTQVNQKPGSEAPAAAKTQKGS